MVRDLTKSMISFSWAMSLFGMNQMINVIPTSNPNQLVNKVATDFNSVTDATARQLQETLQGAFQLGDRLQKGAVDFTLDLLSLQVLNPSRMMKATSDLMRDSSAMFGQSMPGAPAHGQQASTPRFQTASRPAPRSTPSPARQRPSAAPSPPSAPRPDGWAKAAEPPPASAGWGPVPPAPPA